MKPLWIFSLVYLCIVNITGFILMGIDKKRALTGEWRIRESVLFLFSVIGGSIGTLAGMFFFRHKTRKLYFRIFMPLILILQLALAAAVLS